MKPISNHVIHEYMSVLVGIYRGGVERIHADSPEMASLARRDDFNTVLDHLCSADYIHLFQASEMAPVITLTDKGKTYLETYRDFISERRWTRGLAIAAIVISLFALILELDDRGYLGGMLSRFKSSQSAAQSSQDL